MPKIQVTFDVAESKIPNVGFYTGEMSKELAMNLIEPIVEQSRRDYFSGEKMQQPHISVSINGEEVAEPTLFRQHRPPYLFELEAEDRDMILRELSPELRKRVEAGLEEYRTNR